MSSGTVAPSTEELRKQTASCASWFFWIAAMTMINSVTTLSGSESGFAIGLTISMVVDALTVNAGSVAKLIAVGFNAACAGLLVFFGWKARRGLRWAFGLGLGFYGLDTLLSLIAPNAISIGLHAWALFSMGLGWRVAGRLRVAEAAATLPPVLAVPAPPPLPAVEGKEVGTATSAA